MSEFHPVVERFVQDAGSLSQSLGLGRVPGQMFAYLYFSPVPRNLADMETALGISKGSASTIVRQLEQWGAVRKIWVKGDRKDYYQAVDWFGRIVKNLIQDQVRRKMTAYAMLLDEVGCVLDSVKDGDGEGKFLKDRIERLRQIERRVRSAWDSRLVRKLLE